VFCGGGGGMYTGADVDGLNVVVVVVVVVVGGGRYKGASYDCAGLMTDGRASEA